MQHPLKIKAINGGPISTGSIMLCTKPLSPQVSAIHMDLITFLVTVTTNHPIILGFPSMRLDNPQITWQDKEIIKWSKHGFQNCLHFPSLTVAMSVETPNTSITSHVPTSVRCSPKSRPAACRLTDCTPAPLTSYPLPHPHTTPFLHYHSMSNEPWNIMSKKLSSRGTFVHLPLQPLPASFCGELRGRTLHLH